MKTGVNRDVAKILLLAGWTAAMACAANAAPIWLKSGTIFPGDAAAGARLLGGAKGEDAPAARGLYLVQSSEEADASAFRDALAAAGALFRGYVPESTYIVEATAEAYAKIASDVPHSYLGPVKPEWRMASSVLKAAEAAAAHKGATRGMKSGDGARYTILLFEDTDCEEVAKRLDALDGCEVVRIHGPAIDVRLEESAILEIASWVEVHWIEPFVMPEVCNDVAANLMGVPADPDAWPDGGNVLGLTGANQVVAVCDTGLDTGDMETLNDDFRGRVISTYSRGRRDTGDWSDGSGHGTHVAGSVLGSGANSGGRFKGIAYEAELTFFAIGDDAGNLTGLDSPYCYDLFEACYTNQHGKAGARIFSNSWGQLKDPENADLFEIERYSINKFMFDHPDSLIVFAAGNIARDASPKDGVSDAETLNPAAESKNCLAVGASESLRMEGGRSQRLYNDVWPEHGWVDPIASDRISRPPEGNPRGMAAFSGRGPTSDGRMKPDIVAPGTDVISVRSHKNNDELWSAYDDNYAYSGGTSMATPLVSGTAALVREWLQRDEEIANPDGATIKAVLLAGAKSLAPGQYGDGEFQEIPSTYPNSVEGWGEVNLRNSVTNENGILICDGIVIGAGEVQCFPFEAKEGESVTVVMAYTDAPVSMLSGKGLVNDLDLGIITPSGKKLLPNCLEPVQGETVADHDNNIEGIRIPCAEAGTYRVSVTASGIWIPMDQRFTDGRRNAVRYSMVVNGGRQTHYAVCVGVNELDPNFSPDVDTLSGCVKDAENISSALCYHGDWDIENINVLTDSLATKAAIRAAITNVAAIARPGDTFVFTQSSHGGSQQDSDGAYTKDVALIAYDDCYWDYELAEDLAKFPSGVKVVVMVDACHSGGLFQKDGEPKRALLGASAAPAGFNLAANVSAQIDRIRGSEKRLLGSSASSEGKISSDEIGWITAANYNQISWDSETEIGGEFTLAVLEGWMNGYCDDAEYGNADNYADFYELWNYAKDKAKGRPGSATDAQCFNSNVLLSVRAGWVGAYEMTNDNPPRIRAVEDMETAVGKNVTAKIRVFSPLSQGKPSLSIDRKDLAHLDTTDDGAVFSFTPPTAGKYVFTVTAENDNGSSSASFTVVAAATEPSKTWAEDVTTNAFTVCWEPIPGAEDYELYLGETYSKAKIFRERVGNVTSRSFTDLVPGVEYYFLVRAIVDGIESNWTTRQRVTTHRLPEWTQTSAPSARAGMFFALDLTRFFAASPAPTLELVGGDGDARIDGTLFTWTPTETGDFDFTVVASNHLGVATNIFTVKVGEAAPKKFAVCTGINEYRDMPNSLRGCVNDASFMAANLTTRGDWDSADVTLLTETCATKAMIRTAITNIAAQARSGDTFIYMHSSHGGLRHDTNTALLYIYEGDPLDPDSQYNDSEIAEDLAKFPSGVKVAVIVDACYSGGLFKDEANARSVAKPFDIGGRVLSIMNANRARLRMRGENVDATISPEEIGWITAADYNETAMDFGFYHSDEWITNVKYGREYYDDETKKYNYPASYKPGATFLAYATWGWWKGFADEDAEIGGNDNLCNAYEFWKCAYDFCANFGDNYFKNPEDNFHPQCTNITVLQSIELGRCGSTSELPEIADDTPSEVIASQLAGCADNGLVQHVADAKTYGDFKDWATNVCGVGSAQPAGASAVMESAHSWVAFALDADELIDSFENDDIEIWSFEPVGRGDFTLEVGIKGVEIGEKAKMERLLEVFGLEGSPTLVNNGMFLPRNVTLRKDECEKSDGKVKLVAEPAVGADCFFIRVKIR